MCVYVYSLWCWICLLSFDSLFIFFFKQKTAYEMRISDWSSDVCSSDLETGAAAGCVLMAPVPPSGLLGPGLSLAVWNPTAVWEIGAIEVVGERYATPQTMRVALFSETMPAEIGRASCRERGGQYG